ncbi:hypothetical protein TNIN_329401 [Trichonephila inaurata madagascariensis]|uniref:Uncharacterized protein n=1 Tax=Trichonephila inaurata madagascariensis TaxID=2747483 RepID=A0A8X6YIW8_9ARAC|nr:hypothetical protein TNIN_329401 [Trichonephila inaurata madagascariensis]
MLQKVVCFLLTRKDEGVDAFQTFQARTERFTGNKIISVGCDYEDKFQGLDFKKQLEKVHQLDITRTESLDIRPYCDADYTCNRDDRQSIGEFIVFVGRPPVSWKTAKQNCVIFSSMESEHLNITETSKELV